ncbi:hypothetical protein LTR36_000604 [Oleoguttula mirabilis]|uniref:Phytanoyl-CoA dioxygenase n=1 Tax=Oleoguttula mirabilis TaxID=1507867 RepID=A0AAV9JSY0_9PEZI|nr:hypothetical protein LTR36_000604 [Oleoguttula mirabilis]
MATAAAVRAAPLPIDHSYTPQTAITHLSSDASLERIVAILDRDGGVIIDDFVTLAELEQIKHDVAQYEEETRAMRNDAVSIIPKETILTPSIVGKSATVAAICESPLLTGLREEILSEKFTVYREGYEDQRSIDPLLSISVGFNIGPGAPRQYLHRDDNIHGTRHERFDIRNVTQFACLIAGCETNRQNGATMFVPGSHRWDDKRQPRIDEITFAEMKPGSALIFLGGSYHGGGHNATDAFRTVYGLFFIRGTLRQEENQFLAVPHSKVLAMTEGMQSLLGYKQPKSVLGIVDNKDPMSDLPAVLKRVAL